VPSACPLTSYFRISNLVHEIADHALGDTPAHLRTAPDGRRTAIVRRVP